MGQTCSWMAASQPWTCRESLPQVAAYRSPPHIASPMRATASSSFPKFESYARHSGARPTKEAESPESSNHRRMFTGFRARLRFASAPRNDKFHGIDRLAMARTMSAPARVVATALVLGCLIAPTALAETYPDHPIRLISPNPAGGANDTIV